LSIPILNWLRGKGTILTTGCLPLAMTTPLRPEPPRSAWRDWFLRHGS
jgi:hypothetical protein